MWPLPLGFLSLPPPCSPPHPVGLFPFQAHCHRGTSTLALSSSRVALCLHVSKPNISYNPDFNVSGVSSEALTTQDKIATCHSASFHHILIFSMVFITIVAVWFFVSLMVPQVKCELAWNKNCLTIQLPYFFSQSIILHHLYPLAPSGFLSLVLVVNCLDYHFCNSSVRSSGLLSLHHTILESHIPGWLQLLPSLCHYSAW